MSCAHEFRSMFPHLSASASGHGLHVCVLCGTLRLEQAAYERNTVKASWVDQKPGNRKCRFYYKPDKAEEI